MAVLEFWSGYCSPSALPSFKEERMLNTSELSVEVIKNNPLLSGEIIKVFLLEKAYVGLNIFSNFSKVVS